MASDMVGLSAWPVRAAQPDGGDGGFEPPTASRSNRFSKAVVGGGQPERAEPGLRAGVDRRGARCEDGSGFTRRVLP
jgi:hypothetical protein